MFVFYFVLFKYLCFFFSFFFGIYNYIFLKVISVMSSKTCRHQIQLIMPVTFLTLNFQQLPVSFYRRFNRTFYSVEFSQSPWHVKSKWQVMICVWCKCLSTFLTWAMKASLFRVVEQVLSATKPNAKIHNTVTKSSLIQRDRDCIETPENTWASGATGFRYVTNSLQKNTSQIKLCLFRLRRAALPSCKLLAV